MRWLRSALMADHTHPSAKALFRFSIVSEVLVHMRAGASQADAFRSVCARSHALFGGSVQRVSVRSLYRWLAAYRTRGIDGLESRPRLGTLTSSVLPQALIDFLVTEKYKDHPASIPELLRRASQRGILKPGQVVHRSTVYRTCKRLGLPLARCKHAKDRDSRRFAFPHRLDMVLCDGKHFRAGDLRKKRVALFYLDDASRHVLHLVVGTTETQDLFLQGLYECLQRHGFMRAFYVDRGPGFIAEDTVAVFGRLGIPLIHGEAGYKEGRGKVERFNRTVKADVLRGLDGCPGVDPSCGALELRLRHYTDKVYALRPHEGLRGDTPWKRFSHDPKTLRFPEDDRALRNMFEVRFERRVTNDHVVSVDSVSYEVPRGYAGRKVTLRRQVLDGTLGLVHDGNRIDLHPVDLPGNAHASRAKGLADPEGQAPLMPPTTAAELAFQHEFGPVVDAEGGFAPPQHDRGTSDTDDPNDHPNPEEIS